MTLPLDRRTRSRASLRTMPRSNDYEHDFEVHCPIQGEALKYRLIINSENPIDVRRIRVACSETVTAEHEELADHLKERLGGDQMLTAKHGNVFVRTKR
jgi:hypothetical protein